MYFEYLPILFAIMISCCLPSPIFYSKIFPGFDFIRFGFLFNIVWKVFVFFFRKFFFRHWSEIVVGNLHSSARFTLASNNSLAFVMSGWRCNGSFTGNVNHFWFVPVSFIISSAKSLIVISSVFQYLLDTHSHNNLKIPSTWSST
jgi:hypothetical protein